MERSFADLEYESKKNKTRRELFLETMEDLMPWDKLVAAIKPYYPQAGKGRAPYPLEAMLRVHCVQLFSNLGDAAMEDMLYEVESVCRLSGVRLRTVPEETTILKFRHLLERHGLGKVLFEAIQEHSGEQGLKLKEGRILDASTIAAPSSRKKRSGEGDAEMEQTGKGKQWQFGMKLQIGVDEQTGLVDSLSPGAAKVHDLSPWEQLRHGEEVRVWCDAGYRGIEKSPSHEDGQVSWPIGLRAGQGRKLARD